MKLQYKDRFFVTLPKEMVEQKGWNKGDDLYIYFNAQGHMEIKKKDDKKD